MTNFILPLMIIGQIILIFILSRELIKELFYFLRIFIKREKPIYILVSLFFLPGTIIHEMGHFLAATILALRVYDVRIFPQWEKNQIKLGSVLYEKKDIVRGILVGIAPLFFSLSFFWFLAKFHLFPQKNIWLNFLFGYIVYTVSSTMFSSKQDLVDLAFIIPLIIIFIGVIYVFNIRLELIFKNKMIIDGIIDFFQSINFYLFFSLVINLILIFFFKSFRLLIKK